MSNSLLNTDNISVSYGRSKVIHDVSFSIKEGEIASIIGPNGAGKTTIFNVLSGLKEYQGSIKYNESELSGLTTTQLVESGLIHCTQGRDLFPYFTVKQNLLMGAHSQSNSDHVDENLETVYSLFPRLEERTEQNAYTLSGGEQQMLAIGRSLMSDPELLLLDEPTLGLAPVIIEDIREAIEGLRDRGMTILLAEQNVTFSIQQSDRIYLLENGEISMSGAASEFESSDYIQDAYIGVM
jgi:branched-chain amino acid transport system ATP-binding protein